MKFEPKTNQIIFGTLGLMCAVAIAGAAFGKLDYSDVSALITGFMTGVFALMKDAS